MHAKKLSLVKSVAFGTTALLSGLFMGGSVLAQDASPASTPVGPSAGYPVAVHQGTCSNLTEQPKFTMDNATAIGADNGDNVETIGKETAAPTVLSVSGKIDSTLDDLANDVNAIVIHQSADQYDTFVACGNIAGVKDDGKLVIALNSYENGTVVGIAILDQDNSGILNLGDDQVQVTVYIFDTQDMGEATPAA
ncbi:MAG TPA: hypothetical protein VNZ58_10600 [Thermomicrobiales bacterium]|nr:hypothetical protein [Thermomicrobiales bacterium]